MKILLLIFLLISNTWANIPREGDFILPFNIQNYSLEEFIKDYAESLKINISYSSSLLSKNEPPINIYIHDKTSIANFTTLFKSILDSKGYSLIEEKGFFWISPVRDVRFLPLPFYNNQKVPNDGSFVSTIIHLKYPIAADINSRVRMLLSRYGRMINFSDGKSLVLFDKGETILKLIETIKFMDTEEVYQSVLNKKPSELPPEENETNKKIIDLELKNKILEKKVLDSKGGEIEEIINNSNSSN